MSWLIFDAILGIVLVLAVVQGYRKGFVLTLCGFLAVFVAFFGAGGEAGRKTGSDSGGKGIER